MIIHLSYGVINWNAHYDYSEHTQLNFLFIVYWLEVKETWP
jgi:hypothetical protein